jgi:hypothetical protein
VGASGHELRWEVRASPAAATPEGGTAAATTADPASAAATTAVATAMATVRLLPRGSGHSSDAFHATVRGDGLLATAATMATVLVATRLAVLADRRAAPTAEATVGPGAAAASAAGGDEDTGAEDTGATTAAPAAVLTVAATTLTVATVYTLATDGEGEDAAGRNGERPPRLASKTADATVDAVTALGAKRVDLDTRDTVGHGEMLEDRLVGHAVERRRACRGCFLHRGARCGQTKRRDHNRYQEQLAHEVLPFLPRRRKEGTVAAAHWRQSDSRARVVAAPGRVAVSGYDEGGEVR